MSFSRFVLLISIFVFALGSTGCSLEKVPAGHVGIKVYLLGNDKGVDHEELGVGRYFLGINEELYLFPTFKQNYSWTKTQDEGSPDDESITFQTTEGLSVNADVGITYHINPEMVSDVFAAYRRGLPEITDTFLRNKVRDSFVSAASDMPVESVYGKGKRDLIARVEKQVGEEVGPIGIVVEDIYLLGDLRLPETVVAALNAKIGATQRAEQRENELREAQAEAKKKVAKAEGEADALLTNARAQAKANLILSKSITPNLVQYEMVKRWNGKVPQVNGSEGGVLLNLGAAGK